MPTLLVQAGPADAQRLILAPGTYTVGRDPDNSIPIDHDSLSGKHCTLTVFEDGQVVVRDAGSTNGITVDGERVGVGAVMPGQVMQLGGVTLVLEPDQDPASIVVTESVGAAGAALDEETETTPQPGGTGALLAALPGSLAYPLRRDAWMVIAGAVALLHLHLLLPGAFQAAGWVTGLLVGVYLFQMAREALLATANWEDDLPPHPNITFDAEEIRDVGITYVALVAVSFGPAMATQWIPDVPLAIVALAVAAGVAFFPMACLAVILADRLAALNPVFVVRSIARAPAGYLVPVLCLGGLLGLQFVGHRIQSLIGDQRAWMILASVIGSTLGIYLLLVWVRILGLFYRHHQDRLAWEF